MQVSELDCRYRASSTCIQELQNRVDSLVMDLEDSRAAVGELTTRVNASVKRAQDAEHRTDSIMVCVCVCVCMCVFVCVCMCMCVYEWFVLIC